MLRKKKILYTVIGLFILIGAINLATDSSSNNALIDKYNDTYWAQLGESYEKIAKIFEGRITDRQQRLINSKTRKYKGKFLKCIDTEISDNYHGDKVSKIKNAKSEDEVKEYSGNNSYEILAYNCLDKYVDLFTTELTNIVK